MHPSPQLKQGFLLIARVLGGSFKRDAEVRLMRDGEQVFKGKLASLKRFKDDAREVTARPIRNDE